MLLQVCHSLVVTADNALVLHVGTTAYPFNFSAPLQIASPAQYRLFWNVLDNGNSVQFGVECKPAMDGGWVALGFNPTGKMTPSRAILALLPTGATKPVLSEFSITSISVAGVAPAKTPVITHTDIAYTNGIFSFVFTLPASSDPHLYTMPGTTQKTGFIYAVGPRPASLTQIGIHKDARAAAAALGTIAKGGNGTSTPAIDTPSNDSTSGFLSPAMREAMIAFHAVTMAVCFLF